MTLNFYFVKNTEILKLTFLDFWLIDFFKNFREGRGVVFLSMYEFLEKLNSGKKVTENFSKFFWGGPPSQGVPKFYERVGVVDRGPRPLSNGENFLALRLSYLELNWILLKHLNLIFSKIKKSLFVEFSGKVRGSIVYRCASF